MRQIRFICLILITAFVIGAIPVYAQSVSDGKLTELISLGIADNINVKLNSKLTRAKLAKYAIVMQNYDKIVENESYKGFFSDVSRDRWYSKYIEMVYNIGLMTGDGNGNFNPDNFADVYEASEIMVKILGYEVKAKSLGGKPEDFHNVAMSLGILKNVDVNSDKSLTEGNFLKMISNSLNVDVMKKTYGNDKYYIDSGNTLKDVYMTGKEYELYEFDGVVRATPYSYTDVPISNLRNDEVLIENTIYRIGRTDIFDMIGMNVHIFVYKDENDKLTLHSYYENTNTVLNISGEDISEFEKNKITYFNDKQKSAVINGIFLYNGLPIQEINDSLIDKSSVIKLIDNNDDNKYDYVFINSYENGIVDYVGADFVSYRLTKSLQTMTIKIDDDKKYQIKDSHNNDISISDIKKDDIISVFKSKNGERIRIIQCSDRFDGMIAEISDDEITVDKRTVKTNLDTSKLQFDKNYTFFLDWQETLVYIKSADVSEKYCYIAQCETVGGLNSEVRAKVVSAGAVAFAVDVDEQDVDSDTVPLLIGKNEYIDVLSFADRVVIDGNKYTGNDLVEKIQDIQGNVYIVFTNENNEITKLNSPEYYGGSYTVKSRYNVYDKCFGGSEYINGFFIDDTTKIICIPENVNCDEDYEIMTRIDISGNAVGYLAQGYERDEDTGVCKLAVITMPMDSSLIRNVQLSTSKLSVVKDIRKIMDGDDEYYSIDLQIGDKQEKYLTKDISNKAFSSLRDGDLITYILSADDKIENVLKIVNLNDVFINMYRDNGFVSGTEMCGVVNSVEFNLVDSVKNVKICKLSMSVNNNTYEIDIPTRNQPVVYIYYSASGNTEPATLYDIIPGNDIVYTIKNTSNTPRAVIIIR